MTRTDDMHVTVIPFAGFPPGDGGGEGPGGSLTSAEGSELAPWWAPTMTQIPGGNGGEAGGSVEKWWMPTMREAA